MTSSYFPIQRSVFSTEALTESLLSRYALETPISCQLYHRGVNDTYLVNARNGSAFLRISLASWRTHQQVEAEVKLLESLAMAAIATPQPLYTRDGQAVHTLAAPEGERYAVLFGFVDGEASPELDADQCQLYGQLVARMHKATDDLAPITRWHHDPCHLIDEPLKRFAPYIAHLPGATDTLTTLGERLHVVLNKLPRETPIYGLCHGDLRAEHIFFRPQGDPALIDFDEAGYGWRIYDIATFLWPLTFPVDCDEEGAMRDAFLTGYQSVRPLCEEELQTLPYFVLLRHLWATGMAFRYFPLDMGIKHINPLIEPAFYFAQALLNEIDATQ